MRHERTRRAHLTAVPDAPGSPDDRSRDPSRDQQLLAIASIDLAERFDHWLDRLPASFDDRAAFVRIRNALRLSAALAPLVPADPLATHRELPTNS